MSEKQCTLKSVVLLEGVGLHSGQKVNLELHPAPVNHWYKFQRTDIENAELIESTVENVSEVSRGTTLEKNGVKVCTVEHLLSALYGLQLDNVLIKVSGQEMPIFDGSARFFVEAILKAGIEEQQADRVYYSVRDEISYQSEDMGTKISIHPFENYTLTALIDYNSPVLTPQYAKIEEWGDGYAKELANARTFVFLHELEYLFNNNLIKGGDLDNAIVFVNNVLPKAELERIAGVLGKPSVEVLSEGILNNVALHSKNEPAKHKLMDMIGDMALLGCRLKGRVFAERPGHAANVAFVKMIRQMMAKEKSRELPPRIDLEAKPLYDINDIKHLLPHRPPFLLIDKILYMDENEVVGVKNVTMNEEFFRGHFPNKPVMPGVLQIEAMAQVGGIYVLSRVPDPENYLTYFLKLDQIKFRQQVVPGDTLVFRLELMSPIRRGLCQMKGRAYVGNNLVAEAELLAQVSKK